MKKRRSVWWYEASTLVVIWGACGCGPTESSDAEPGPFSSDAPEGFATAPANTNAEVTPGPAAPNLPAANGGSTATPSGGTATKPETTADTASVSEPPTPVAMIPEGMDPKGADPEPANSPRDADAGVDPNAPSVIPGNGTTQESAPLDCGPDGWAVEDQGPPENRVNYVILGDGYDAKTIHTTLEEHVRTALKRRFEHETGEPYGRYRKFVNICVMKVASQSNGIGRGPTAFSGGNGGDRLARVDRRAVYDYLDKNLPENLEPSWTAVVLNQDRWENTGATVMLWSGGNSEAAGAALHEGGHGFHQLADEYGTCTGSGCGENTNGSGKIGIEYEAVNSTGHPQDTAGKWDLWLGSTQVAIKDPVNGRATGVQGTFSGSHYQSPTSGQYRPSDNSMMNSLFGLDPNTSFNSVSREQMVFSIWQFVRPIDSTAPAAGPVAGGGMLRVNVIDPAVINVDWSVDGALRSENGGTTFDTTALVAGTHVVTARAYDNATQDLVRLRTSTCPGSVRGNYCHATAWKNHEQTVQWTVIVP